MNKIRLLAALALGSLALASTVSADQFGDFTYTNVDANTVEITGFTNPAFTGHVEIPSSIEGKTVTSIKGAFQFCKLSTVTIPGTVTNIGDLAFAVCSNLDNVIIPDSVLTLGDSAFYQCHGLQTIRLGTNVQSIAKLCFFFDDKLTEINFPPSLRSIGERAFAECNKLTTLTLPQGLTTVGQRSFYQNLGLTNVTIPSTLTNIGYGMFQSCPNLIKVNLTPGIASLGEGMFHGCTSLQAIAIPEGVASIGRSAFLLCTNLAQIGFPRSIRTIGDSVFYGCDSLEVITIPEGVTSLGDTAFWHCDNLTTIIFPASLNSVGSRPFTRSSKLATVLFKGNAPATFPTLDPALDPLPAGFSIYFLEGKTGFTTPSWRGYPTTRIGSQFPAASWLLSHQLPFDTDLTQSLTNDGRPLVIACALDLNPHLALSPQFPKPALDSSNLSLTFFGNATGITYTVEQSTDLRAWSSTGVTLSAPDSAGNRTATTPRSSGQKFIRISVTLN